MSSSVPAASTFVSTSLVPFASSAFLTVREIRLRSRRDFQNRAAIRSCLAVGGGAGGESPTLTLRVNEELVARALL